jgi:hypothetical protein
MQTITIKINDSQNVEFLIELLRKFNFVEEIEANSKLLKKNNKIDLPIRKPIGIPSIEDFAGMWKDNPKTLEQIRYKAWKRAI